MSQGRAGQRRPRPQWGGSINWTVSSGGGEVPRSPENMASVQRQGGGQLPGLSGLGTKLCPTLVAPWAVALQAPLSIVFSRQECWSGGHSLLQGIFLTQGSNPGLLHGRQILYRLSHQGSPPGLRSGWKWRKELM